jgi:hypothetical protein
MARRRKRRTTRRGNRVSFTTRRGRRVSFRRTGRGHRKTAWNKKFGAAARACRRKRGVRPFTKAFGKCMKAALKKKSRR